MIPKFRAWDTEEKRMIWNVPILCGQYLSIKPDGLETKDFPLMQSTGLEDKNGVEIFEGDIVNITHYFGGHPRGELKHIIKRSKYNSNLVADSESGDWRKPEVSMSSRNSDDYEVIGNIYENPELFEVEDE